MHLTPCQATRERFVAGIARDESTGQALPFRRVLEEQCILPEHKGHHMFPSGAGDVPTTGEESD